ncbi:MAG: hypothetical protein EOP54_11675 [Sphingobacteriales bacterium]|nr:MAG: hypothetical protein EOP54_11675 [Sphingobacteriales bacterium]
MDIETVNYIITHFRGLMTDDERIAHKYRIYSFKTADNPQQRNLLLSKGWMQETPESCALLKQGEEAFERNVANRIMIETPEKVFLNNCLKCFKLVRTPLEKQYRHCGHNWHNE